MNEMFSAQQKWACAQREWAYRNRVYPRWVAEGKMSKAKADHELAVMLAIEQDYRKLAEAEAVAGRLI